MMALIEELFPICRSITGDGVRQTLEILGRMIPIEVKDVPSGTTVFDWTVPPEWNIRDAYIALEDGSHVVDFAATTSMLSNIAARLTQPCRSPSCVRISIACPINPTGFLIAHPIITKIGAFA